MSLRPIFIFSVVILLLWASNTEAQTGSGTQGALTGAGLLLDTVKSAGQSNVQFVGARSFKDEEIRAAIGEQVREIDEKGVTPARADDAAFYVASFYRRAGFSQVETSFVISGSRVTVRIREGPRTFLRKLNFVGNRSFTDEVLFEYMIGAKPSRLESDPELFPFNQNEVNAGADRVRGFYVSEGFLDVTVDATRVTLSRDGRAASVVVRIEEGTRYTFGEIVFEGQTVFSRKELIAAARENTDGPFSRTKAIAMQRNLESFFRTRGYFTVEVGLSAEPAQARGGRVPVRFTIKPGAIYRFDGVVAKNQTSKPRLRESFLPRRFRHLQGQVYSPEKVDEPFRELLRSGLFSNLRYNPTALPDHTVRLDFTFEEAKAREVGFTLGYGTYDGYKTGIRLADRNLFGNGRPLSLDADYSQRGLDASLMYVDPWFLDFPRLNMRAKIFSADRTEEGYTKHEVGARVELGWRAMPHLEIGTFAQASKVKITDADIAPELLGPTDYKFVSIGLIQTTDYRDDVIAPKRGWIFSTAIDVGTIDGQRAFTRSVGRFSYYKPIGKMQLALGARAGIIEPVGDEGIPIDIRFFNGGATTVRSFAERDLGPKDKDDHPLGGEFFTVFNAELTFPIVGALQGAVFTDAGNLRGHTDFGVGDMRYAIGLGLRYALPVGPIRLDYGVNPDRRDGEDFGALHFSFGVAF